MELLSLFSSEFVILILFCCFFWNTTHHILYFVLFIMVTISRFSVYTICIITLYHYIYINIITQLSYMQLERLIVALSNMQKAELDQNPWK
jgi:hypothetical protein